MNFDSFCSFDFGKFIDLPLSSILVSDLLYLILYVVIAFLLVDLFCIVLVKYLKRPLRRIYRKTKKFFIRKISAIAVKRGI